MRNVASMASFEIIGPGAGTPAPPGPWITRPAQPVAFSADTAPEAGPPIWRVSLPTDPQAAWAALSDASRGLRAQAVAIESAQARIMRVAGGGDSFAVGRTPAPELALLGLVDELRAAEYDTGSFGIRETVRSGWEDAEEKFRAFAAQVHAVLTNYAVVETHVGLVLIGRTRVGWTGDVHSLLASELNPVQADMHRRALALAIESRTVLLHTFTTVLRGAVIVATMISSPVGAVAALPAAWKFIDQLLTETRSRRSCAGRTTPDEHGR